jgi:hypothetical protein
MATHKSEYSNSIVGNYGCTYKSLCGLGCNTQASVSLNAPNSQLIIPNYSAVGYNTLSAKVPSCTSYSNIENAYGSGAGGCNTSYATRLCSGASCNGGGGSGSEGFQYRKH